MDESVIPRGLYCYDEKGRCPYLGRDKSREKQGNGFCTFLDRRDWDNIPGIPLLWDGVKECNINMGRES